jgi:Zn-finger nucleic acid-binding protein
MIERTIGCVEVDACELGCRGLWLEFGELTLLEEASDGVGRVIDEAVSAPSRRRIETHLACPICNIPMREHTHGANSRVLIDECYGCRGLFLDVGELTAIREEIAAATTQVARVEELLAVDPVWQAHQQERRADREFTKAAVWLKNLLMQRMRWWTV